MKLNLEKYIIFDSVVSYLIKRGQDENTVTVSLGKPNITALPSTKLEFAPGVLEDALRRPVIRHDVQKQPNIQQEFKVEQPRELGYVQEQVNRILRPYGINLQAASKFLGQVRQFVKDENAAVVAASHFGKVSDILGFVPSGIKNLLTQMASISEPVANKERRISRLKDLYAGGLSTISANRDAIVSTLAQTDLGRLNDDDIRRAVVAAGIAKQLLPGNEGRVEGLIDDVLNIYVSDETRETSDALKKMTFRLLNAIQESEAKRKPAQRPTSPSRQPLEEIALKRILEPHWVDRRYRGVFSDVTRKVFDTDEEENKAILIANELQRVSGLTVTVPKVVQDIMRDLNKPEVLRNKRGIIKGELSNLYDIYRTGRVTVQKHQDIIKQALSAYRKQVGENVSDLNRLALGSAIATNILRQKAETRGIKITDEYLDKNIQYVFNYLLGTGGSRPEVLGAARQLTKQMLSREGINVAAAPAATQTAETPTEAPVESPIETPAETPTETPAEAPKETPVETPAETSTGTTTPGATAPAEETPTTPEQAEEVTPSPPTPAAEERAPVTPRSRVDLSLQQVTAPIYRFDEEAAGEYLPLIRKAYGAGGGGWWLFSSSDPEAERKANILAMGIQQIERMIGGLPLQVTDALENIELDPAKQRQRLENLTNQYSRAKATVYQNQDIIREVLSKYEGRADLSDQDLNRMMLGAALTADVFGDGVESNEVTNNQRQLVHTARVILSEFVGNRSLKTGMVDATVEIAQKILERRGLTVGKEPEPAKEQPPKQPPAPEQSPQQTPEQPPQQAPEQPAPEPETPAGEGLAPERSAQIRNIAKFIGIPALALSAFALALGDTSVLSLLGLTAGILGVMYGFGIFDKMGIDVDGLISQIFGSFGQKGGGGGGAPQLTEEQKKILSSEAGQKAKAEIRTRMDNYSKIVKQGASLSPDLLTTPITQIDVNRFDQSKEGAALKGIVSSAAGLIYYYGDTNIRANIAKLYDQAIMQGDLRTLSVLSNYLLDVLEHAYVNAEANSEHMSRIIAEKGRELSNLDSFMQKYGNKDITIQEIKNRLTYITQNRANKSSTQLVPIAILLGGLQNTLALTPETSNPKISFANSYITGLINYEDTGWFKKSADWWFVGWNYSPHFEKVSVGLSLLQAAVNQSR